MVFFCLKTKKAHKYFKGALRDILLYIAIKIIHFRNLNVFQNVTWHCQLATGIFKTSLLFLCQKNSHSFFVLFHFLTSQLLILQLAIWIHFGTVLLYEPTYIFCIWFAIFFSIFAGKRCLTPLIQCRRNNSSLKTILFKPSEGITYV